VDRKAVVLGTKGNREFNYRVVPSWRKKRRSVSSSHGFGALGRELERRKRE